MSKLQIQVQGTWVPVSMVDYVSDTGVPNGTSYEGVVSEYPSDDVVSDMEWTCVPDTEPEEQYVSLTVSQFADMLVKVRKYDVIANYVTQYGVYYEGQEDW